MIEVSISDHLAQAKWLHVVPKDIFYIGSLREFRYRYLDIVFICDTVVEGILLVKESELEPKLFIQSDLYLLQDRNKWEERSKNEKE